MAKKDRYKFKVDNSMRGFGETDLDRKVVKVNKKRAKATHQKGELLDTIAHELLHVKHPKAKERTIQKKTERVTKRLSPKEKAKLYSKFRNKKH